MHWLTSSNLAAGIDGRVIFSSTDYRGGRSIIGETFLLILNFLLSELKDGLPLRHVICLSNGILIKEAFVNNKYYFK